MYCRAIIFFCFLSVVQAPAQAQSDSSEARQSIRSILVHDGSTFVRDAVDLFWAPGSFVGRDWICAGAIVGGTAALFPADEGIRDFSRRQHRATLDDLADIGNQYVVRDEIGPVLYLGGLFLHNEAVRVTGLQVIESLAFASTLTQTLKFGFGRSRPYLEEGAYRYRFFQRHENRHSLPSGHATNAFALYSVLAARIHRPWASVGFYGLATVAALSRIYVDAHWASDVLLGAAIGTVIGNAVVRLHETHAGKTCWRISPAPGGVKLTVNL